MMGVETRAVRQREVATVPLPTGGEDLGFKLNLMAAIARIRYRFLSMTRCSKNCTFDLSSGRLWSRHAALDETTSIWVGLPPCAATLEDREMPKACVHDAAKGATRVGEGLV